MNGTEQGTQTEAPAATAGSEAGAAGAAAGSAGPGMASGKTPGKASGRVRRGAGGVLRALRRHLGLLAVVVLLLAAGGFSGTVHWQLQAARSAYADGDFDAAQASGERFLRLSPWERHKGHFAVGTAHAGAGRLDEAEAALGRALELAPEADECAVRQNLALVQEEQADTLRDSGDTDGANSRYDAARATLEDAPEECRPEGSEQDQQMDGQQERVEGSQKEMNSPEEAEPEEDQGSEDSGEGSGEGDGDAPPEEEAEGSEPGGGSEEGGQDAGGGSEESPGEGGAESEKLEELRKRQGESEERYSESNSGQGSGVRGPDVKPW